MFIRAYYVYLFRRDERFQAAARFLKQGLVSRTEIKKLFRCHAPAVGPEPGTGSTGKYHCNHKIIKPSRKSGRSSQMISNRAVDKFFTTDEIVTYLKSDQNNFRIYPIGPLFGESRFAAFGLESIGGYHPAKLKIYNDFLQRTGNAASIPVLRMMNTKYLISPQRIENPYLTLHLS